MVWSRPRFRQSRDHSRSATPRQIRWAWILACCILYLCAGPPIASAQTISYVYDELGRLVGVIDPSQGTAH